ncbi:MFS transporter [Micromonospora sp. WMMA1363]|nr:MFS transporter [Micromonospora sp. WMMA1363]MDM4723420.1 MFS transporter [Micromonospora sp. WMMA1363]
MPSILSVLRRNGNFRNLFLAELVVFGADWFVMVPLLVLLPSLTGSGVWGALVLAVDTGIVALLLPYTGTVADRFDRRKIMIGSNIAAVLGVLLLLGVRGAGTAWLAMVGIGVVAVAKAFYSPAAQAALPNVLDRTNWRRATRSRVPLGHDDDRRRVPGRGAQQRRRPVRLLLGCGRRPGPGGGSGSADPPAVAGPAGPGPAGVADVGGGPGGARLHRAPARVLALVTVKSAVGLGNGVLTVFPLLAGLYGAGPIGTGLLFAVRGAGALVGPILMRRVLGNRAGCPGLALSMSLYGLAYLGTSVADWFPVVLVLVFVAHFAGGSNWVMSNFALQGEVPDRLRGRVFATDMMLATLAISVSQMVVASVVDVVDERVVLAGCGLVTLVYAVGWRIATRRLSLTDPVVNPDRRWSDSPRTGGAAERSVPRPPFPWERRAGNGALRRPTGTRAIGPPTGRGSRPGRSTRAGGSRSASRPHRPG